MLLVVREGDLIIPKREMKQRNLVSLAISVILPMKTYYSIPLSNYLTR